MKLDLGHSAITGRARLQTQVWSVSLIPNLVHVGIDRMLSMDRRMSYTVTTIFHVCKCLSESSNKMYLKMP